MFRSPPFDQAHGLRRLFAHAQVRFVPVVSNPHVAFGGLMLERLCRGFTERGIQTLVVDSSENAALPGDMALLDLAECIEPLSAEVSYLAARGLPTKFVDATGSTRSFMRAVAAASPSSQIVLVHATPSELCRLFSRRTQGHGGAADICPLLLADDRPASVTHAYGAMKLLALRADLRVHDLLLGAAASSPRAERIAVQIAVCADEFLGAVLRDWVHVDPAVDPSEPSTPALRRWVDDCLQPRDSELSAFDGESVELGFPHPGGTRFAASNRAFN
ncbi:MAG: flagellar biosynthesis protein [Caldimonas sp.]